MEEKIKSYKDLLIWKKGIEMVRSVYKTTEGFPRKEIFGLSSQMRRAAVSVPSNIAEGQARRYSKEFIQFLYHALGSLAELETQVIVAGELNYLSSKEKEEISMTIAEIQKMIYGLIKKVMMR